MSLHICFFRTSRTSTHKVLHCLMKDPVFVIDISNWSWTANRKYVHSPGWRASSRQMSQGKCYFCAHKRDAAVFQRAHILKALIVALFYKALCLVNIHWCTIQQNTTIIKLNISDCTTTCAPNVLKRLHQKMTRQVHICTICTVQLHHKIMTKFEVTWQNNTGNTKTN